MRQRSWRSRASDVTRSFRIVVRRRSTPRGRFADVGDASHSKLARFWSLLSVESAVLVDDTRRVALDASGRTPIRGGFRTGWGSPSARSGRLIDNFVVAARFLRDLDRRNYAQVSVGRTLFSVGVRGFVGALVQSLLRDVFFRRSKLGQATHERSVKVIRSRRFWHYLLAQRHRAYSDANRRKTVVERRTPRLNVARASDTGGVSQGHGSADFGDVIGQSSDRHLALIANIRFDGCDLNIVHFDQVTGHCQVAWGACGCQSYRNEQIGLNVNERGVSRRAHKRKHHECPRAWKEIIVSIRLNERSSL